VSERPFDTLDLRGKDPQRREEFEANFEIVAEAFAVAGFATMHQVHGCDVAIVGSAPRRGVVSDGLVTASSEVALCVRVADCVPVVLADADEGVLGVAHAGRPGVADGVVTSTVDAMRALGAGQIHAWVGPHVCGGCYEVPFEMRADVAHSAPAAFACTTWGTPSLDLGAAVTAQLEQRGCTVSDVSSCTKESRDFYSYRRDGEQAGRFAGLVVLRGSGHA
jgi:YfiH family protein